MSNSSSPSGHLIPFNSAVDCPDSGDTSWMLISAVLVLGMMPALAFFESGLLRRKNALSVLTQVLSGLVVLQVLWFIFGFSLTFGPDHGGVIGDLSYAFYMKIGYGCLIHAPKIPGLAFAMFQAMFAAITPLLMTGTFAERMKFNAVMGFIVLWEIFVYYPLAHWVWGGGFLGNLGVLDFAGGIVIHTSAGTSSVVIALMLGQRRNFKKYNGEFTPHNIPLASVGAALLWVGWYGFNAGSALTAGPTAAFTITATTVAPCVSTLTWIVLSASRHNKVRPIDVMNGAIAGLAGITPASGYVQPYAAAIMGFLLGVCSYFGVILLREKFQLDDALDVSSMHGIPGIVGSICIGIFADINVNPNGAEGIIYGGGRLLGYQIVGVLVSIVWAGLWTWLILTVKRNVWGLKVTEEEEDIGLDQTEHGNLWAYDDMAHPGYVDTPTPSSRLLNHVDTDS